MPIPAADHPWRVFIADAAAKKQAKLDMAQLDFVPVEEFWVDRDWDYYLPTAYAQQYERELWRESE